MLNTFEERNKILNDISGAHLNSCIISRKCASITRLMANEFMKYIYDTSEQDSDKRLEAVAAHLTQIEELHLKFLKVNPPMQLH